MCVDPNRTRKSQSRRTQQLNITVRELRTREQKWITPTLRPSHNIRAIELMRESSGCSNRRWSSAFVTWLQGRHTVPKTTGTFLTPATPSIQEPKYFWSNPNASHATKIPEVRCRCIGELGISFSVCVFCFRNCALMVAPSHHTGKSPLNQLPSSPNTPLGKWRSLWILLGAKRYSFTVPVCFNYGTVSPVATFTAYWVVCLRYRMCIQGIC